jgi:hypothetical protein
VAVRSRISSAAAAVALALAGCSANTASGLTPAAPAANQRAASAFARPNATYVVDVTFQNKAGRDVELQVWKQDDTLFFWRQQVKECVKASQTYHTSVSYDHPNAGPKIRFKAYPDCDFFTISNDLIEANVDFGNGSPIDVILSYLGSGRFCMWKPTYLCAPR